MWHPGAMVAAMAGRTSSSDIDALLHRIARRQHGLVTIRQLATAGIAESAMRRRCASGQWEMVVAGVCRTTATPSTVEQRLVAAGLALPHGTLIGPSSALVDGMPVGERGAGEPVVAVADGRSARTVGITVVRMSAELPVHWWNGVRVATPAATIVTLPRFVSAARVERCLDHCLVERLTTVDRVRALLDALPARAVPGRQPLLRLLRDRAQRGLGHRSDEEQKVAAWLDAAGLTGWQANGLVDVSSGPPLECDFVWRAAQVDLEVSPFCTHGTPERQARDAERRRLLAEVGWAVIEATDAHLGSRRAFQPIVDSLRTLLARRAA